MSQSNKPTVSAIIVGHKKSGKQTLKSRLEFHDKPLSFELYLQQKKEYKWYNVSGRYRYNDYKTFITDKYTYHIQSQSYSLTKNILSNLSNKVIICIISAIPFDINVKEENIKHFAKVCEYFDAKNIIVCVSKMDDPLCDYDENTFNHTAMKIKQMFDTLQPLIIPISPLKGDNIASKSENMLWYKGNTLLNILDNIIFPNNDNLPFILQLSAQFRFGAKILNANILQGVIRRNTKVIMYPGGQILTVTKIESDDQSVDIAKCGGYNKYVFIVTGFDGLELKYRPGAIISIDQKFKCVQRFIAVMNIENLNIYENMQNIKLSEKLYSFNSAPNEYAIFKPTIFVGCTHRPCTMLSINWRMNKNEDENVKKRNPEWIQNGDIAEIIFESKNNKPLVLTRFDECDKLGRIAIFRKDKFIDKLIMYGKVVRLLDNGFYTELTYGFIKIEIEAKYTLYVSNDVKDIISAYLHFVEL